MVQAKCIMDAYDSPSCQQFKMGSTYEIERDGTLASLKTSGGKLGKYVFEFDRNAGPDDKPHDYSCKKDGCGKKFKTLAALGTHTKTDHKDDPNPLAEPDAEIVKPVDGRKVKGKSFTCKHPGCGEVLPHLYALKVHKKTHEVAVEQAA